MTKRTTIEAQFCRTVMLMRGISDRELASRTGFAQGTLRNLFSNTAPYADAKIAIEQVLDCRIWSTPAQFREHQRRHHKPNP